MSDESASAEAPKWDITRLTDEELGEYTAEQEAETLRRKRLNQWWVCISCGVRMGYDYVMLGAFDESGCVSCGHTEAVKVVEETTE